MALSLDIGVIDGLRSIAQYIANTIYWADFAGNYFRVDALNARRPAYEIGDTLKCFCTSEHATIIFSNIRPVKILSVNVGAPIRENEHETDMSLKVWNNAGGDPFPQSWEVEEEEKITEARDILTEISTSIKAKVGGGGPVFQASLEAELSAKVGVNLKRQEEKRTLKKYSMKVEVPAWTNTSLSQRQSIADIRQIIEMRCLIDASVSLVSQGEWSRWAKHFTSIHELENYLRGGGGGESENSDGLDKVTNTRQFQDFSIDTTHLELEIVEERVARNVKTGETNKIDTPIENPNAKRKRKRRKRNKGE